ncbi:MAG: permease [Candidatus Methanoperedens sp.]|nr:permease [Candidatus Methanoperedens sp.]
MLYDAMMSGLLSVYDYLSLHVLTCLVPAFFIAGAIAVFISKQSVIKYFSSKTKKIVSYGIASVSGTVLAVCSCTILPLFAGIYKRGAGIGPATTFLYSGPAINILAIIYTAQILGFDLGAARAVLAIIMSILIGLIMAFLFKGPDINNKTTTQFEINEERSRPQWVVLLFFVFLVLILIVGTTKLSLAIRVSTIVLLLLGVIVLLKYHFTGDEVRDWGNETWDMTKKIFPVLIIGTFAVGVIAYYLPPETFRAFFGGNSLLSCFTAAIIGALFYMPTLLEVPIIGTTLGYSTGVMGGGPALSLLLSGPSVSLPSMLVLQRIMGTSRIAVYILLVVLFSTIAGFAYGNLVG